MQGIKHSLNSFKEKYYTKFPDSKIEILEILPKEKVRCKDKYSEYITRFASLFNNYLPTFTLSLNKKQHFTNKAKEVHGDKYDYSLVDLNKMTEKVKIICKKHGEFQQRGTSHLFGQGCYKCKDINHILKTSSNTDEFIKKANLKHNFKYDYSLVNYINSKTVLKIICPIHGKFEQMANSHLNGKNCGKCARESISKYNSKNPSSWNYINWEKAGNNSKNFDSFKLYIIECYNENEKFYKIGKTYRKVEKRFNSSIKMPYKYKIIKVIKGDSRQISILEKELQRLHKEYKYIPNVIFKGNNECFITLKQKEIKEIILKYIKK